MTLALSFDKDAPILDIGSRWLLRGSDPVTDMWADVTVTKHDGMGYYAISPTISVQGGARPGEHPVERWVPSLGLRNYERVLR